MPVIARDTVASDHLVYAWPFPIGPDDYEVSCADDELVVMCPAWLVGDRLGPGRHRWRSPDPTRQSAAYFVLTAPVEVSFDMITAFIVPATGQSVRLRSIGSLQVRCMDPALLVAQFVGLPFDSVNEGVLRSVSRSIERMLARLLTRRVVMAGTPQAVTDPQMLSNIVEELVAYNPTAGAVFGIELLRFGHLSIMADDGNRPWQQMTNGTGSHLPPPPPPMPAAVVASRETPTMQQPIVAVPSTNPGGRTKPNAPTVPPPMASGPASRPTPPLPIPVQPSQPQVATSGEINVKPKSPKITAPGIAPPSGGTPAVPPIPSPPSGPAPVSTPIPKMPITSSSTVSSASGATASGTLGGPKPPKRPGVETTDEPTHPGVDVVRTPVPAPPPSTQQAVSGEIGGPKPATPPPIPAPAPPPIPAPPAAPPVAAPQAVPILAQGTPAPKSRAASESADSGSRGSIMGIGVSHIGSSEVASGEITKKIAPGGRVLVPGPNGLMQSATVRQLLSGYYELEVGGSGETIWVPVTGVVPE